MDYLGWDKYNYWIIFIVFVCLFSFCFIFWFGPETKIYLTHFCFETLNKMYFILWVIL